MDSDCVQQAKQPELRPSQHLDQGSQGSRTRSTSHVQPVTPLPSTPDRTVGGRRMTTPHSTHSASSTLTVPTSPRHTGRYGIGNRALSPANGAEGGSPSRGANGRTQDFLCGNPNRSSPGRRSGRHRGNIPPASEWKSYLSMQVKILNLPADVTTWDIHRAFLEHANVLYIEKFEKFFQGKGQGNGARIQLVPPRSDVWGGYITIIRDGHSAFRVKVEVDPNGFVTGSQSIMSPVGRPVRRMARLEPSRIAFGTTAAKSRMIVMGSAIANTDTKDDFTLMVDFEKKWMNLYFLIALKEEQSSDPSDGNGGWRTCPYRIDIKLSHMQRLSRIDGDNGLCSVIIPLRSPPRFYRKVDHPELTHFPGQMSWGEHELWRRQVYLMDEPRLMKEAALGLNEKQSQLVKIGRWTTYCLQLPLAQWTSLEESLRDFNIKTDEVPDFGFADPEEAPVVMWDLLDKEQGVEDLVSDEDAPKTLPFDVRYQLEACISRNLLLEHSITAKFLSKLLSLPPRKARVLLEYVVERKAKFFDAMQLLEDIDALEYWPDVNLDDLPDYCTMIRKVVVTPTTIYYNTPTVDTTNRVLRQYSQYHDRFLRVQFTDEITEGRIHPSQDVAANDEIYARVYRTLKNGIKVGGRHFRFLAFGNSQLRESAAYFFCDVGNVTCDSIRAWMGKFSHIRNVGKYAARIGQCFSSTRNIRQISLPNIVVIPDIYRGPYCFTDGVGKISMIWAAEIRNRLNLKTVPSAFQFRMGGCKGVLVAWNDIKGYGIHIRESQKKFESEHSGLEIIRCSHYSVATLNRQTITILSSLGVDDSVFEEMLEEQLADYDKAMKDPVTAVSLLSLYVDENQMTQALAQLIMSGLMKTKEPFVWTLLRLWRTWSIKSLKEKARLVVTEGAFVLGVVDETAKLRGHFKHIQQRDPSKQRPRLNTNIELPQIFIQVAVGPGGSYRVITGTCLVGRNPSLHPGDIRVVEAVDVPELAHLKDVVVFAQTGDRDLPNMCSGGDLDGDDYFVIWDEKLIPPRSEWNADPMDYTPRQSVVQLDRDVTSDDLQKFFVLYLKNQSLGSIAHAHLAQADGLTMGAKSPVCHELAMLHSQAVDYPKTGVPARMPRDLRPRKYPHFMEKGKQKTYRSGKVLGKLYDMVQQGSFHPAYELPFDRRVLSRYPGLDEALLRRAREIKCCYDEAMRRIMGHTEIATEFEVFSAFVLSRPRVGNDYKRAEDVGRESAALKSLFRQRCIDEGCGGSKDPEVLAPFVAAMYKVTDEEVHIALHECRVRNRKPKAESMPLISFPWIFDEVLVQLAAPGGRQGGPSVTAGAWGGPSSSYTTTVNGKDGAEKGKQGECDDNAARPTRLRSEDIDAMGYVRTKGRIIHRGVLLNLFRAVEDEDGDENWPDEDSEAMMGVENGAAPEGKCETGADDVLVGSDSLVEESAADLATLNIVDKVTEVTEVVIEEKGEEEAAVHLHGIVDKAENTNGDIIDPFVEIIRHEESVQLLDQDHHIAKVAEVSQTTQIIDLTQATPAAHPTPVTQVLQATRGGKDARYVDVDQFLEAVIGSAPAHDLNAGRDAAIIMADNPPPPPQSAQPVRIEDFTLPESVDAEPLHLSMPAEKGDPAGAAIWSGEMLPAGVKDDGGSKNGADGDVTGQRGLSTFLELYLKAFRDGSVYKQTDASTSPAAISVAEPPSLAPTTPPPATVASSADTDEALSPVVVDRSPETTRWNTPPPPEAGDDLVFGKQDQGVVFVEEEEKEKNALDRLGELFG